MKVQKLKSQKGITLVALVITIVILIILAGITIAQITGENGLFKRAKQAKQNTLDAQNEENVILADYDNKVNEIVGGATRETETLVSCYPKGTPVVLDEGFSGTNEKKIVAPDDGWVVLSMVATEMGGKWYSLIVGNLESAGGVSDWVSQRTSLPCTKGTEITYASWGANFNAKLTFIPMK
ncbi:hypothetical protein EGR52_10715 [bacterium]|nr:hypothetical protein [bacterium]